MDKPSILSRPSRCGLFLRILNAGVTIILCVAVVVLFIQVQYMSHQLRRDHNAVAQLKDLVANQQQGEIAKLTREVKQEQSLSLLHMAGTFTLITGLLTMFHISTHLRHFHQPIVQRKILAILWMPPIYAGTSFLSLLAPPLEGYLAVIKDFYEAYCIYMFLSFLIAVLGKGDRDVVVQLLTQHVHHLKRPSRWFQRWYHPPPHESDEAKANAVLVECQICAMQFVFCRPLTSIASFVAYTIRMDAAKAHAASTAAATGQHRFLEEASVPTNFTDTIMDGGNTTDTDTFFTSTSPSLSPVASDTDGTAFTESAIVSNISFLWSAGFILAIIQSISVGLAFSGLLKFYHAVSEDLKWCQPFSKFLCIKGVVFMTFWQGLVISIVVNVHGTSSVVDPVEKSRKLQNVLICLEMLFFAVAHWCTFPTDEWEEDYRPQHYAKPGLGFKDFASDVSVIFDSGRAARQRTNSNMSTDGNSNTASNGSSSSKNGLYLNKLASSSSSSIPGLDDGELRLMEDESMENQQQSGIRNRDHVGRDTGGPKEYELVARTPSATLS